MIAVTAVEPVRKTIRVRATPQRAFDVFTAGMGRWWPPTHSIGSAKLADVVLEPKVGGRWYERGEDGTTCTWGKVLAFEPPSRLVLAWQLDATWRHDATLLTEVELRFVAEGPDWTRVELEHRRLEAIAPARAALDSPGGWSGLLERYAAALD
jgi:uncharacterized protein YndB with AHSA1/START domain